MERIELGPKIYAYPNFLTQEEIDFIYNRAANAPQEEWDSEYDKEMEKTAEEQGYVTQEEKEYFFNNINKKNPFWKNKILTIKNTEMCLAINDRFFDIWKAKDYELGFPEKIQRQYVNGPKVVPTWSQKGPRMVPKWSQNGPQMVPKWSQNVPKWS